MEGAFDTVCPLVCKWGATAPCAPRPHGSAAYGCKLPKISALYTHKFPGASLGMFPHWPCPTEECSQWSDQNFVRASITYENIVTVSLQRPVRLVLPTDQQPLYVKAHNITNVMWRSESLTVELLVIIQASSLWLHNCLELVLIIATRLTILEKCDIESVIGISYCSEFSYSYG